MPSGKDYVKLPALQLPCCWPLRRLDATPSARCGRSEDVGVVLSRDLDADAEALTLRGLYFLDHAAHSPRRAILSGVAELDDDVRAEGGEVIEDDRDADDTGVHIWQAGFDHATVLEEVLDADQCLRVDTRSDSAVGRGIDLVAG
jgi:hypothetical protein